MIKFKYDNEAKASAAEGVIRRFLNESGVRYYREVSFPTCFNTETNYLLRFDFYIPKINTLIEYDGIDYHKEQGVKKRDAIKTKWAKEHGIRLIRLQGMKNIEKFFNNELNVKIDFMSKSDKKEKPKRKIKHKVKKTKPTSLRLVERTVDGLIADYGNADAYLELLRVNNPRGYNHIKNTRPELFAPIPS